MRLFQDGSSRPFRASALVSFGFLVLWTGRGVFADETWEYAVQLSATVQSSPPEITLNWVQDGIAIPQSYTVYRKGLAESSWGMGTVLPGEVTAFTDTNVAVGMTYEYQVHKVAARYDGYGYLYSGIEVPIVEERGTVLLMVDNTWSGELGMELARLQQDLVGDGWNVIRQDFSRTDSAATVKSFIQAQYEADTNNVNTVFLFGHIPVPYSGDLAPDEHAEHTGAWPADVYYADLLDTWTDSTVNDTNASDPRNWNVPGDGKFDQSVAVAPVQLMVGRVDLSNLPGQLTWNGPATFPNELELLRNYLNKDHNFRRGLLNLPRRGVISDFLGDALGEAYSASGWRNFSVFFGPQNITYRTNPGDWITTLRSAPFLWAYGSGSGTWNGINELGFSGAYNQLTAVDLVAADPQAAFYMVLGSWFGDWDHTDDFMRAVLATPTCGLTCCWSGMPHWFCQHMALGQTIGWSTRCTQNNGTNGLYKTEINAHARMVHIALMGDPTLRMHPVISPSNLSWSTSSGGVTLTWTPSTDPAVLGYHVYRATGSSGPFSRLTGAAVSDNSFTDPGAAPGGSYMYMVRALKLEQTPSGSYYNLSQGTFLTLTNTALGVHINSVVLTTGGLLMTWDSTPGGMYRVSYANNLAGAPWTDVKPDIAASGTSLSWTDPAAPGPQHRFYRLIEVGSAGLRDYQ